MDETKYLAKYNKIYEEKPIQFDKFSEKYNQDKSIIASMKSTKNPKN